MAASPTPRPSLLSLAPELLLMITEHVATVDGPNSLESLLSLLQTNQHLAATIMPVALRARTSRGRRILAWSLASPSAHDVANNDRTLIQLLPLLVAPQASGEEGLGINELDAETGRTPLHFAVRRSVALTRAVMRLGAVVDASGRHSGNALQFCCYLDCRGKPGARDVARVLMEEGGADRLAHRRACPRPPWKCLVEVHRELGIVGEGEEDRGLMARH